MAENKKFPGFPDKPKTDTALPQPYMTRGNTPLVMLMSCGNCTATHTITCVVVPGFYFPCPTCGKNVEKGCVISCAHCGTSVCADCVYNSYLRARAAQLTAH